jgi:hypothetical protein
VRVGIHREGDRVEAQYLGEARASGFLSRWWQGSEAVSIGRFVLPSTGELEYRNSRGTRFILRTFFTPGAGAELHITLAASVRHIPFVPAMAIEAALRPLLRAALRQDQRILSRQRANAECFADEKLTYIELDIMRPHIQSLLRDGTAPALRRTVEMEL